MIKVKTKDRAQSPLKVPVVILAVVVTLLFVIAGMRIGDYARGYSFETEERSYVYAAEGERFGDLYEIALRDMGKDAVYGEKAQECRALAFYYEQAVLEHAYRQAGQADKADEFAARMADYESQLGSFAPKAQAVREAVAAAGAAGAAQG